MPGALFSVFRATHAEPGAREARAGAVLSTESSVRRLAAEFDPLLPVVLWKTDIRELHRRELRAPARFLELVG
jgi:hypothetical protein